jgi:predicted transcriptional regulator
MKQASYSSAFIEQALSKVYQRGDRTIRSVADELNINHFTLRYWMRQASKKGQTYASTQEKRPQDWSLTERLGALYESHGLTDEALHTWCREKGLFAHHLTQWHADFCNAANAEIPRLNKEELRAIKEENQKLKRELSRKEKALAEAAALLVLQKKFHALLGEEVE